MERPKSEQFAEQSVFLFYLGREKYVCFSLSFCHVTAPSMHCTATSAICIVKILWRQCDGAYCFVSRVWPSAMLGAAQAVSENQLYFSFLFCHVCLVGSSVAGESLMRFWRFCVENVHKTPLSLNLAPFSVEICFDFFSKQL